MDLLAIDQGNSRTKFGLFVDGVLQQAWAVPTVKPGDARALQQSLIAHGITAPARIGLCSVVPEALPGWQALAAAGGHRLQVIDGRTAGPLRNAYATPETLGPDRLMAAVAAAARVGTPVIPISLGTAIVVDAVSAEGVYLGGMIAPGIDVIARALASSTSALTRVDWHAPREAIGRSSLTAQESGLYHLSLGGIRTMIAAAREALGSATPLVLTGGWASRLAPCLDGVALVDEQLILTGIALTLAAGNPA